MKIRKIFCNGGIEYRLIEANHTHPRPKRANNHHGGIVRNTAGGWNRIMVAVKNGRNVIRETIDQFGIRSQSYGSRT